MSDRPYSCIAVDWGTSNRRAWTLGPTGDILHQRADDKGLLAHADRRFAQSLELFLADWLTEAPGIPVIMAGMVGSRLGWIEVPYVSVPVRLTDLANHLVKAGEIAGSACWVVPGINMDDDIQPEVMRGEECQMLGALLRENVPSAVFVTPGTHSKWARVIDGRLTAFRTYITGELFDLLCKSGTLSQVMIGSQDNPAAFARGVAASADAELLNRVFSVRTFGLFGKMPGADLRSYLSGLLVGTEMRDALRVWPDAASSGATCIGSAAMIARYQAAAAALGLRLQGIDNDRILPLALYWVVRKVHI